MTNARSVQRVRGGNLATGGPAIAAAVDVGRCAKDHARAAVPFGITEEAASGATLGGVWTRFGVVQGRTETRIAGVRRRTRRRLRFGYRGNRANEDYDR